MRVSIAAHAEPLVGTDMRIARQVGCAGVSPAGWRGFDAAKNRQRDAGATMGICAFF